jgi:hypothetical protein
LLIAPAELISSQLSANTVNKNLVLGRAICAKSTTPDIVYAGTQLASKTVIV